MPTTPFSFRSIAFRQHGPPRYEQLSQIVEKAIREGRLHAGDRLPPVRQLAEELSVSVTTVAAAFKHLSDQKLIRSQVGRGTFVAPAASHDGPPHKPWALARQAGTGTSRPASSTPWRRRALMTQGAKLRTRHPEGLDCSTGRPDVALLPRVVLQRAWPSAVQHATAADLQYSDPGVIDMLAAPLIHLFEQSDITVSPEHLLIGSSAQQWMMLALEVAGRLSGTDRPAVAVEEPGYPSIMDAFERAGARLLPVSVDELGAVPESLDAALASGAAMTLLTPRAHNPTGASWSVSRRQALAAVVADHPHALVVEDDQFADGCATHPGSLLNTPRVGDRVIYIRSFSKLIAPDLRVAAAAAHPRLRGLLADAKSFADGWTSRLLQKTLALVLADEALAGLLTHAREEYRLRRSRAAVGINAVLQSHGGSTWCGPDGLNLWVRLPPDVDAMEVAERSAAAGVRIAPGEPFFIRPGHTNVIRLNAGSAPTDRAEQVGHTVGAAVLASRSQGHSLIHV